MSGPTPSVSEQPQRLFSMQHDIFGTTIEFTEETRPSWLNYTGPKGSTMDNSWFWDGHVMKLEVGQSVDTDFQKITRLS